MTKHLYVVLAVLAATPSVLLAECTPFGKLQAGTMPFVVGWRFGTPQRVSFYAGPAWHFRADKKCVDGVAVTFEPGLGGGQLSGGYIISRGLGLGRVQGSLLRTWGRPWNAPAGATFAGVEAQWSLAIGLRVGRFYQVSGPRPGVNLTTLGVVVGF